jgi:2-polyprenyl-6-hydroxyphenyl methylase/3-demethylubiquinone-9 3-methyltransferase
MQDYYSQKLSAARLQQCYACAPPRVQRYLAAEIDFVLQRVQPTNRVLELGCGYGRVMQKILPHATLTVGIDTSAASLQCAWSYLGKGRNYRLVQMNALELGFRDKVFDVMLCIQNGISAFRVDRKRLICETLRVTRKGGILLFSTYAAPFWSARLEWFRVQAILGLIGEIDEEATGNGIIACKDGFLTTALTANDFRELAATLNVTTAFHEVDASSLFCEIQVL